MEEGKAGGDFGLRVTERGTPLGDRFVKNLRGLG
jgi:hypothetical protein